MDTTDPVASYKKSYSNEQSINFIVPIMIILFLGIVYIMSLRYGQGAVSFILIGIAAATMIYWGFVLKNMTRTEKPKYTAREAESKNWVYDLIKGNEEIIFVAEVPGPDDKIMVRLIDGVLYVRGSGNFSKEVPIDGASGMEIADFKYRNGVLTLRIRKPLTTT
ncbi:MAG TPA: Hsp20/alpha crystallin family protein [Candidatus Nitrosotenuis sp.]|nr:Hsp20/alpha crystallin family protein [Candidatus Nitrosotenuis sp.]